jgi:hypothetical protein
MSGAKGRSPEDFTVYNVMLPRTYYPAWKNNLYERRCKVGRRRRRCSSSSSFRRRSSSGPKLAARSHQHQPPRRPADPPRHPAPPRHFLLATPSTSQDIADALQGGGMAVDYDQILAKRPNSSDSTFAWHADAAYWPPLRSSIATATCWLAVSDATRENGCMRFVPGSHHEQPLRRHFPGEGRAGPNRPAAVARPSVCLGRTRLPSHRRPADRPPAQPPAFAVGASREESHALYTLVDEGGRDRVAYCPIPRGDITVHNERVVHGSGKHPCLAPPAWPRLPSAACLALPGRALAWAQLLPAWLALLPARRPACLPRLPAPPAWPPQARAVGPLCQQQQQQQQQRHQQQQQQQQQQRRRRRRQRQQQAHRRPPRPAPSQPPPTAPDRPCLAYRPQQQQRLAPRLRARLPQGRVRR